MSRLKKDKERRSQEEYLRQQNMFIKTQKGGYREIADMMQAKFPEMSWAKFFNQIHAAFNRQVYPKNAYGNPDKRFIRELINTTNEWLIERERIMKNAIRLAENIRGMRDEE